MSRRYITLAALLACAAPALMLAVGFGGRAASQAHSRLSTGTPRVTSDPAVPYSGKRPSKSNVVDVFAPLYGTDVNMPATSPGTKNEFQIDINPYNSQYAIGALNYDGSRGGVWYYITSDGGFTWAATPVPTPSGTPYICCDPGVAYDLSPSAYLVFQAIDPSTSKQAWVMRTKDNGATWTAPVSVAPVVDDHPGIAIDRNNYSPHNGSIYITYVHNIDPNDGLRNQIWGAYSSDNGLTWSAPFPVGDTPPEGAGQQDNQARVAPDGTLYVAYQQYQSDVDWCSNVQNVVARSTSLTPPTPPTFAYTTLNIVQRGVCVPVDRFRESTRFCADASPTPTLFRSLSDPILAIDPGNPQTIYMVYSGGDIEQQGQQTYSCGGYTGTHSDTLFRKSLDGGVTWSSPRKVNTDPPGKDQYFPWMDVAPNGTIWVGWNDRRDDPNHFKSLCYQAYSTDDGVTWHEAVVADKQTQPSNFLGDYHGLAATNDKVLGMWYDSNGTGGNGDPFTDPNTTSMHQKNSPALPSTFHSPLSSLTPMPTETPTHTPAISPTTTNTPTPVPTCGAGSNYIINQTTGAAIVAGTSDTGNHCDDCISTVSLPFTYSLYGVSFNSAFVSSNGQLELLTSDNSYSNACLPSSASSYAIFPHWDDLSTVSNLPGCPSGRCGIFTSISGQAPNRVFNIEWRAVYYSGSDAANFEVRLYEGQDRFDLVYGQVDQGGSGATIGVQHADRVRYTEFECNSGSLFTGLQLSFAPAACGTPAPTTTGTPPTATPTYTPTSTPTRTRTFTPTVPTSTSTSTPTQCGPCPTSTPTGTACPGAYHYLVPEVGGPPIGGTVNVGQKFVLDLQVNAGTYDTDAQETYLTYTYSLLQNVSVIQPGCVLTDTITPDTMTYDVVEANEVCNGPTSCVFHGTSVDPGSIGFASSSLSRPFQGEFRIARIAFCAIAPGQATIRWQFMPSQSYPDTLIYDFGGNTIQNQTSYVDYVINIVSNSTPTPTANPLLLGHVTWQGPPPQPSQQQQLSLKVTLDRGSTQVNLPSTATDASGYITASVAGLAPGTYTWWAKGARYLANEGSVTLAGEPVTNVEMGLMRAGDADNDNRVGLADFSILRQSYGLSSDLRADFNNDGVIDVADFTLLRSNFGAQGAPPPGS